MSEVVVISEDDGWNMWSVNREKGRDKQRLLGLNERTGRTGAGARVKECGRGKRKRMHKVVRWEICREEEAKRSKRGSRS
jgi:hypothetical protein